MEERITPDEDLTARPFDPELTEADEANSPDEPAAGTDEGSAKDLSREEIGI